MVHVYIRYSYKWLVCVRAHPRFLARQIAIDHGRLLEKIRYIITIIRELRSPQIHVVHEFFFSFIHALEDHMIIYIRYI